MGAGRRRTLAGSVGGRREKNGDRKCRGAEWQRKDLGATSMRIGTGREEQGQEGGE